MILQLVLAGSEEEANSMYSLIFPVVLPPDRTYFNHPQAPVPPLSGGLLLSCMEHSGGFPLLLTVSGFGTEQEAMGYAETLRYALQWASLRRGHSFSPSSSEAVVSNERHFDGSTPTVFPAASTPTPFGTRTSDVKGSHLAILSGDINVALMEGVPAKLAGDGALSLAVELFADVEFVGGTNARFIVLFTALEVLLPRKSRGKRGAVVRLVKEALAKGGREVSKSVGKQVDNLYQRRNDLVHEGKAVTTSEVRELQTIVRDTLLALTKAHS
jgi:hypothetical protein